MEQYEHSKVMEHMKSINISLTAVVNRYQCIDPSYASPGDDDHSSWPSTELILTAATGVTTVLRAIYLCLVGLGEDGEVIHCYLFLMSAFVFAGGEVILLLFLADDSLEWLLWSCSSSASQSRPPFLLRCCGQLTDTGHQPSPTSSWRAFSWLWF